MKHKNYIFWVWFCAVVGMAILILTEAILIKDGVVFDRTLPDASLVVVPIPGGDNHQEGNNNNTKTVFSNASDYSFSIPVTWYAESIGTGDDMTIYPEYDPMAISSSLASDGIGGPATSSMKSQAQLCKLEISAVKVPMATDFNLDDWVTENLNQDPTAIVLEISRMPIEIDGHLGVFWKGDLNDVTTTSAYVVMPTPTNAARMTVLEIVPSTLSEASDAANSDCDSYLQIFLSNLRFTNYASQ